ncbi:hypothetical protein [Anaerovibrio sp.]|uniref:hypothetical protein n=1 Tax=Anaerovibrio sp. TaxID=1872532 RepID=UPI0025BC4D9F|nr:hypothetical protein [Anaerovibrio sp.]MBR2142281.1 hypothetical protein [Anaerovibrio sp.]
MNSQAQIIEHLIEKQPENKILTANLLYRDLPANFSEQAFYQTVTRLTKKGVLCHLTKGLYYRPRCSRFGKIPLSERNIIEHYTEGYHGMVIGYRMYHQYGLTTQVAKNVEVLSNVLTENRKTIRNVKVSRLDLNFDDSICVAISTLEILQNYNSIENINRSQLAEYMKKYAMNYSEDAVITALRHRKYKKSTIAFLAAFLGFWKIRNTLQQYLSSLSTYVIPQMEQFYGPA